MISVFLENCLLRQGFTRAGSIGENGRILKRPEQNRMLAVVLVDSQYGRHWNASEVQALDAELRKLSRYGDALVYGDALFIVATDAPDTDAALTRIPGTAVWLADVNNRSFRIYEDQPSDFFGIRAALEDALLGNGPAAPERAGTSPAEPLTLRTFPWFTVTLILANVAYYIVLTVKGNPLDEAFMLRMGALYWPAILEEHEYWRLFTAMFMHFGLIHLLSNMLYLVLVGHRLERSQGHVRFILLYLISGLAASIVSVLFYWLTKEHAVCAGASGAVYGLLGGMLVLMLRNRDKNAIRAGLPRMIFIIFFIFWSSTASESVDGAAHIGGLLTGAFLGLILLRSQRQITEKKYKQNIQ